MTEKPLYVRCTVAKVEFEINRKTLEAKECSRYVPYDDYDPNVEYMDYEAWSMRERSAQ